MSDGGLTVAVTGPTGTFGFGLIPAAPGGTRASSASSGWTRRPFDPAEHGWTKLFRYRQGDVRDPDVLRVAFEEADVVVHLAFMITGAASRDTIRAINVEGTLNAFRAAAAAGAGRFVYASSVAAYGFHRDNPIGMTEEWPVRPAARLFYAQEKAELERLLRERGRRPIRGPGLYLLRPPIVLGPHAVGAKGAAARAAARARCSGALDLRHATAAAGARADARMLPLQFIHEDDVGQALLAVRASPPDRRAPTTSPATGCVTAADVARELGVHPGHGPLPAWPEPPPAPRRDRRSRPFAAARRANGSRPPAIRRSWTRPRPGASSAGSRDTPGSRRCATPSGATRPELGSARTLPALSPARPRRRPLVVPSASRCGTERGQLADAWRGRRTR